MNLVSPYEAERRGRTGDEDKLTSRFFGHLSASSPSVLKRLLDEVGIRVPEAELTQADIRLWQTVRSKEKIREIDAVITLPELRILFENKLWSSFDLDQLVDEYSLARESNQRVSLVCISAEAAEPDPVIQARNTLEETYGEGSVEVLWTSWQKLYMTLKKIEEEPLDSAAKVQVQQLLSYMQAVGVGDRLGLKGKDDWVSYFRIHRNVIELFGEIRRRLNKRGFSVSESTEQNIEGEWHGLSFIPPGGKWDDTYYSAGFIVHQPRAQSEATFEVHLYLPKKLLEKIKARDEALFAQLHRETEDGVLFAAQNYRVISAVRRIDELPGDFFYAQQEEILRFVDDQLKALQAKLSLVNQKAS